MNKILSKPFLWTLFISQNKWHKHSVLGHTLKVIYGTIKYKRYDLIIPAILHDIGKPFVAYKDEKDLKQPYESYSFTNHEEMSYMIIKNWYLSDRIKNIVRYHYLLRNIEKTTNPNKLRRLQRIKKSLSSEFIKEIQTFQKIDDFGKL